MAEDRFRVDEGKALVVTFIYTKCPMPTFCPLMDRHFATMQAKLKEKNNDLDVRLLSVSFDPVTDTPPVLKRHAQTLGADPRIWTFLTGDRDEIDQWARASACRSPGHERPARHHPQPADRHHRPSGKSRAESTTATTGRRSRRWPIFA